MIKFFNTHAYIQLPIVSLSILYFASACVTRNSASHSQVNGSTPNSNAGTSSPREEKSSTQAPNPTSIEQPTKTNNFAFVTQFEMALGKRDCKTIRSLENQLVAPPESYANSTLLATLWCEHQKNPKDKELSEKLFRAIDQALKSEAPLFDATFLENLRSEALVASGELQAARQSQAKALSQSALEFMSLVSGQVLRSDFQDIELLLTGGQAALLREVRSSLADPLTQAAALTKFDDLLSQVSDGPVKDKLLMARLKLFSAIELAFASQLASLEEIRLKKDAASTENMIAQIRKLFPSRPHQQRIDSLVGPQIQSQTTIVDLDPNQCLSTNSVAKVGQEKTEITSDRALQLARSALNEGKPGDAVDVLDSLPETQKNDKTRSLRRESSQAHIRDLRRKANELYQRGNISGDNQSKLDSLAQCKQILENILSRYPETDQFTRIKIQKFLNAVSENILELRKAQTK